MFPMLHGIFGQGGVTYLVRDLFTSGNTTSPRTATPGPGQWTVGDASGILSISGGELLASGTPGADTYLRAGIYTHTPGQVAEFDLTSYTSGRPGVLSHSNATPSSSYQYGMQVLTATRIDSRDSTNSVSNLWATTLPTTLRLIMRENGGYFYVADERLIWVTRGRDTTSRYVYLYFQALATNCRHDNGEIYTVGGALATEYGLATDRVASPTAGSEATMTANAFIEMKWTPKSGETITILFRRVDDDNTLKLVCAQTGGTIKLYRREAGSDTELDAGKIQTWTVGTQYRISIVPHNTALVTWVNETRKHNTTSTYNQTATEIKVTSTDGTPSFSELVSWGSDLSGFPLS